VEDSQDVCRKKDIFTDKKILGIIGGSPGISKGEFRKYVQEHRGEFLRGENAIYQRRLPELIKLGKVIEKNGKYSSEKVLFLGENI